MSRLPLGRLPTSFEDVPWALPVGRRVVAGIAEVGLAAMLLLESLWWIVMGRRELQPVRLAPVLEQAMEVGLRALPIVTVLSFAIGMMIAIQGVYTLRIFGAESQVTLGVALSVTREFAPLITGILVAGRSGSALAVRIGSMKMNEELAALQVMGIQPVRFLVAPALLAMLVMLPLLTWYADMVALLGAGLYVMLDLGLSLTAYANDLRAACSVDDVLHGLGKSAIFAVLIVLVGAVNGAGATGGADGIGRQTTRSVVHAITAIVITDMLFAFLVTR